MVLHAPAPIDAAPLRLEELPEPVPGPGEILVDVSVCGVCRTDLHLVEGDLAPAPERARSGLVPGHQVVGRVAGRGPGAAHFAHGQRVGVGWLHRTCGSCAHCRRGAENLCRAPIFTGWQAHGGYAERMTVPEDFAYPLPDVWSDVEAAPLLCAGIIGYRALARAGVAPERGGWLGLYGFGSSAHLALQIARHWGWQVAVLTRDARHRELARALGADWVGASADPPPRPLDAAIVFAPAGELVRVGLRALGPGGTLACAGIHMSDIPALAYADSLFEERTLTSVTANTRADGAALLAVAAAIPVRPTTTTFALADANRALAQLRHDALRGSGVLVVGEGSG
jgi:alcohol dehydrogenase, propanol-preferring